MKKTRVTLLSINARMDESRHYQRPLTLNRFVCVFFFFFFFRSVFSIVLRKADE